MYKLTITPPNDLFRAIKALPKASQVKMRASMQSELRPAVKKDVDATLAVYPGPVVHPFEFATAKSRAWYFANKVPKGSKGGSYIRTGLLAKMWSVDLIFGLDNDVIFIYNASTISKWVYPGPQQVPGHARTGWGRDFDTGKELITEDSINLIVGLWRKVVISGVQSL